MVQDGMNIEREAGIKVRFNAVSHTADERTLRRWAGGEAASFGRGGVAAVVRVLRIRSEIDRGTYPTGIKIEQEAMDALLMTGDAFHSEWNYTIHPQA